VGSGPWIARVTPDGKTLLAVNQEDNSISLFDAATLQSIAIVPVGDRPELVTFLPDSSKAFVSCAGSGNISVIDLRAKILLTNLPVGTRAGDLVLKPDGGELFVSTPGLNSLTILNTASNEVAENLMVGDQPTYGAFASDATLYLSDVASGQIRPVVTDLRRLLPPITVGRHPGTSRLTPDEALLVVVNEESQDVAIIRTRTRELHTLIPVGPRPRDLAIQLFTSR